MGTGLAGEQGRVGAELGLWLGGPDWVMPEFFHPLPCREAHQRQLHNRNVFGAVFASARGWLPLSGFRVPPCFVCAQDTS